MRSWMCLGFVCLLSACDAATSPVHWPVLAGKADRADGVPIGGALRFDVPLERDVVPIIEGFTLVVGDGARVDLEVTHAGTAQGADLALALYGPVDADGNRALLASDDDDGYGKLPRLRDVALQPGEHLVAVQRKAASVAHYRLVARCVSGACTPVPRPCDAPLLAALRGCAHELMASAADAEVTPWAAAAACAEDELLGRVHDAVCDSGDAPSYCTLPFERFHQEVMPVCRDAALQLASYDDCALGTSWYELVRSPWVRVLTHTRLDRSQPLDPHEQELIVRAVQASAHTDVTTAAEAFARVDEGVVDRYELADVSAGGRLVAYIYGAGDNTYGRIFGADELVIDVHDGDIMGECHAPGPVLADCRSDRDCDGALLCGGISEAAGGLGRCGPYAAPATDQVVCHGQRCTPAWLEQPLRDIDGIPTDTGRQALRKLLAILDLEWDVERRLRPRGWQPVERRRAQLDPGARQGRFDECVDIRRRER